MQALMCLWGEEERVYFREITEYIEASSLVISDLRRAFMSIVFEGFDITLCQMTKVLSLSSSACSTFPAPRLYKLCYLLSAALRGQVAGGGVPGVAALAPDHRAQTISLGTALPASGQAVRIH